MGDSGHVCEDCKREFQNPESLGQHRQAKHVAHPQAQQPKRKGSMGKIAVAVVVLLLIAGAYFVFAGGNGKEKPVVGADGGSSGNGAFDKEAFAKKIPKSAIHWHPHVTILIRGQPVTIPANVGLETSAHKPVHTHEPDNILHWEVDRPTVENMQLGYFFNTVWRKQFSKDCILDSCNGPEGTVKMFVNGSPNEEFDHYMPHDGDEIKIVFE